PATDGPPDLYPVPGAPYEDHKRRSKENIMRRRNFLALTGAGLAATGLAACGGSGSGDGGGAATTLRLAFNQTENHPQYIAFTAMGERLAERTDGALGIEVYPNETLGAQQEAIQLLQDGS